MKGYVRSVIFIRLIILMNDGNNISLQNVL